ncbi:MAG: hypothetical protein NUV91_04785, partial [Candidatus Omnitrophica bacterium]|nr:hypothetical protein [Candidatus Omnitrophota bacterium]
LDLGFGLTKISLKKYFLISMVASPARILFVQYFLAMGVGSITDPQRIAEIMMQDPVVFVVLSLYGWGAIIALFFMKKIFQKAS